MRRSLYPVILGSTLGFLLLLVSAGAAQDILLDPLRDFLVRKVTGFVSNSLHGSVEIGSLKGSLLSAPVLQGVTLKDAQGNVIAEIAEIRLRYRLTSLLKKRLQIQSIEIVEPHFTIVQEADGSINLTSVFASPQPVPPEEAPSTGLPFALIIEDARLRDGQLDLRLPALAGVQTVRNLQARLQAEIAAQGDLQATVQQVTAATTPAMVDLSTFQGALQSRAGVVTIDHLRLQLGQTELTANGVLPGEAREANFALHIQPLDVAEIGRLLANDTLQGQLQLTLQAQGPPDAVQVQGQIRLEEGNIALESNLNLAATPLRYRGNLDLTGVNLASLLTQDIWRSDLNLHLAVDGMGVALAELQSALQIDIEPSSLGNIALHPSSVHVEASGKRFNIQRLNLDTSVAQMTARGTLDLAGTSDLQYDLQARLGDVQSLFGVEPLAGALHVQGTAYGTWPALAAEGMLQGSEVQYQEQQVEALTLTYEGSNLGAQPRVMAHLVVQQVQAGTLPVERLTLDATYQDGQVEFTTEVLQTAQNQATAHGTLALQEDAQTLALTTLRIQLADETWEAVEPLRLTFAAQRLVVEQARLENGEAVIALSGALEGEQLHDLQVQIRQFDLAFLQPLLQLPDPVRGQVTLQATLAGTLAEPRIQGELTLQPTAESSFPFAQLHTTLNYMQQRLQGDLQLRQKERDVVTLHLQVPVDLALTSMPAGQRLQEAPVQLHLSLDSPDLAALQQWQPTLPPLQGTAHGTLNVEGPYSALQLNANMQLRQLGMAGTVEKLEGPLQLNGTVVTAASHQALVQAIEQGEILPIVRDLEVRLSSLRGQLPAQTGPAQPFAVQDIVVRADGQWSATGPQVSLEQLSLRTSSFGLPTTRLQAAARWQPQRLELTRLNVRMPDSEVRGQGYLTFPEQGVQLTLEIPRLRLDALPLTLPPDLPSVVQGTLTVEGTLQEPQAMARLQYAGAQVRADVQTNLQEQRYQASLNISGLNLRQVLPEGQGSLAAQAQLEGQGFAATERRASLSLNLTTRGFNLAPGLTTRLQAQLTGETVQVKRLNVQSTPVTINAEGKLSTTQPVALQYRLTLGDLSSLQPLLGMQVSARGELRGRVYGTLQDLRTQGTLDLASWQVADWQGKRLQTNFSASQLLDNPQAALQAQVAAVQGPSLPATSLRVEGNYDDPRATFTVAVTAGPYQQTRLTGEAVLAEEQRFTLTTLRLQHDKVRWDNAGPVTLVHGPQGALRIENLLLRNKDQEIRVQGRLTPGGSLQGDVRIQQVQIQPLARLFAPEATLPAGRLDANVSLDGTLQRPQAQGAIQLRALQWQEQQLGDLNATLGLRGQTLQTDLHWQLQNQMILRVQGTVETTPNGALNVQLQAPEATLALLESFVPAVTESAGAVMLDLNVTGTLQQPRLQGVLALRDGMVRVAATGERYRDIQIRLVFTRDRMTIERFHVGSRSGPLQVAGRIDYDNFQVQQVDLTVEAQEFTAVHTANLEAVVSTDVQVNGSLQEMAATGRITVPRARIRLDGIPGSGPQKVEPWQLTITGVYGPGPQALTSRKTNGAQAQSLDVPLPFLRTDIRVRLPRNVWIQGPGTAIEVSGDLQVTKELAEPFILSGSIDTVRGFASYYGKKFEVEEGQITFTGSQEINPILNVTVSKEVSDYDIRIHVEGKAQQPAITLSSTPDLPQADILSLIIVGKTTDRLTSGEQGTVANQAQQLAGNVVARQLENTVGKVLGLDTIEVTAGDSLGTGNIKAGRYITQDLFLSYERSLGTTKPGETTTEGGNTIELEYSINRRLKLQGQASDQGETAVDVLWKIDY